MRIKVSIVQSLSTTTEIEVPDDLEDFDELNLDSYVVEQVVTPMDCLLYEGYKNWIVDDFRVIYEEDDA